MFILPNTVCYISQRHLMCICYLSQCTCRVYCLHACILYVAIVCGSYSIHAVVMNYSYMVNYSYTVYFLYTHACTGCLQCLHSLVSNCVIF